MQFGSFLTSTDFKVADFAPPQSYVDLASESAHGRSLYPPCCQLGWDGSADSIEVIATTDVGHAGHIMGYGRPLWKSIWYGSVLQMLGLAITKLGGRDK